MSVRPRPHVPAAPAWEFPAGVSHRLDNGLHVHILDLPGQHVLSLRLGIPMPLSVEPATREGVAQLMARGLDEGTARHTAEQTAERIESHGIALGAGVGQRGIVVQMEVTAAHFRPALDLLAECLCEAAYPEPEVARLRRARLSDIDHEYADPGARASIEFARAYFRDDDRASRPTGGGRGTVSAVSPDDVRDLHAQVVRPEAATLVLAGDLSGLSGDAASMLETGLRRWRGSSQRPAADPAAWAPEMGVRAEQAAGIVIVDRPGAPQSQLKLGRPGPTRRTRHGWGTYQVLAFLLGGSPGARIDAVLREERGYTYGMRASFIPRRAQGLCTVSGAVRAEATAPALAALLEVLDLAGSDLRDDEVRHGADFVAKTGPGRYGTADAIADEVIRLALDGLGPDFVTRTLAEVRSLTSPQAGAAWEEVRAGAGWTTVVVADAAAHAESVQALGLGEVRVLPA